MSTRRRYALWVWRTLCGLGLFISYAACGCLGPDPDDVIVAVPENKAFAEGRFDPNRVRRIIVYRYPPGMYRADLYSDLPKCRRTELRQQGAAEDLCEVLAKESSVPTMNSARRTDAGLIRVVLDDGVNLFLHYDVGEDNEIYICPPGELDEEPRGHWQNSILPWLTQYVDARDEEHRK